MQKNLIIFAVTLFFIFCIIIFYPDFSDNNEFLLFEDFKTIIFLPIYTMFFLGVIPLILSRFRFKKIIKAVLVIVLILIGMLNLKFLLEVYPVGYLIFLIFISILFTILYWSIYIITKNARV